MSSADSDKDSPSARQAARRLIESRQPEREESDGRAYAVAVACNDLNRGLSRWVGSDGCHALFTRALAQTRTDSTTLDQIQLRPGADPYVDGVAESIASHGDSMVAEALESMLVNLVELLERLIGRGMATKLIERSIAALVNGDATSNDRREEA
jgi:hypothetical protein